MLKAKENTPYHCCNCRISFLHDHSSQRDPFKGIA